MVVCLPLMNDTGNPLYLQGENYADYLRGASAGWRRFVPVQLPYRWNLRRLGLGYTLDVGCGAGRNLAHLDGNGVGIDSNPACVRAATERGFVALTPESFATSPLAREKAFEALLFAHVLEHMPRKTAVSLVRNHLRFLKPEGKLVVIVPQPAGFRSDPTHVESWSRDSVRALFAELGLQTKALFSFPFPEAFGRIFPHNETVGVALR